MGPLAIQQALADSNVAHSRLQMAASTIAHEAWILGSDSRGAELCEGWGQMIHAYDSC